MTFAWSRRSSLSTPSKNSVGLAWLPVVAFSALRSTVWRPTPLYHLPICWTTEGPSRPVGSTRMNNRDLSSRPMKRSSAVRWSSIRMVGNAILDSCSTMGSSSRRTMPTRSQSLSQSTATIPSSTSRRRWCRMPFQRSKYSESLKTLKVSFGFLIMKKLMYWSFWGTWGSCSYRILGSWISCKKFNGSSRALTIGAEGSDPVRPLPSPFNWKRRCGWA